MEDFIPGASDEAPEEAEPPDGVMKLTPDQVRAMFKRKK